MHTLSVEVLAATNEQGETTMIADRKAHWMVVEGEVILIHLDGSPAYFARVDRIEPDVKDGWWKLEFLLLTLPAERITWVIEEPHMAGAQFMIGETLIWIEQIPARSSGAKREEENRKPVPTGAKVIPFPGRRRDALHSSCH
jgi:hypothetical protein